MAEGLIMDPDNLSLPALPSSVDDFMNNSNAKLQSAIDPIDLRRKIIFKNINPHGEKIISTNSKEIVQIHLDVLKEF